MTFSKRVPCDGRKAPCADFGGFEFIEFKVA